MSSRIFSRLFDRLYTIPNSFISHRCLSFEINEKVKLVNHIHKNIGGLKSATALKDVRSIQSNFTFNGVPLFGDLNIRSACRNFTARGLKTDSHTLSPASSTTTSPGIHQNIASLHAKKRVPLARKKRLVKEQEEGQTISHWNVVAYATAEEYDLEKLTEGLQQQGLYHPIVESETVELDDPSISNRQEDTQSVVHVAANYIVGKEPREIYFFREGSVVFWNVPELERQNVMKFLRMYEDNGYDENLVVEESEMMTYRYADSNNKTRLSNGEIVLRQEGSINLEKYTFANAMALSVKLGIWEASLDHYVDSIEFVTEDLKSGAKIRISREEVLRKTGELFALRHMINLSSDLLDTPDFYWDRENLEDLYHKTCNHLNVGKRTKVMNEKLNHCVELVELLSRHLSDHHHTRLEWMIIILIMVEVLFEVVHYAQRFF